jgi:succinylglutamate desuccinylase
MDLIIDLHSTTANMGVTLIVPEGDAVMTRAAAYVLHKLSSRDVDCRILLHPVPEPKSRPNLSSTVYRYVNERRSNRLVSSSNDSSLYG